MEDGTHELEQSQYRPSIVTLPAHASLAPNLATGYPHDTFDPYADIPNPIMSTNSPLFNLRAYEDAGISQIPREAQYYDKLHQTVMSAPRENNTTPSASTSRPTTSFTNIESSSSDAVPTIAEFNALREEMANMRAQLDAVRPPPPGYADPSSHS